MKPVNLENEENNSITPSGFFGNSIKMISEIENFLSIEEQKKILNFISNNNVWDYTITKKNKNGNIIYDSGVWNERQITYFNLLEQSPECVKLIDDIIKRLQPIIESFFNVDAIPTSPAIVRWRNEDRQEPHADKELHEGPDAGTPNAFPNYDLASLFYLNDNYEGGELYFPRQRIEFKPKARAAYFFPGDKEFVHGVRRVTKGIRYTIPFFWRIERHR